MTGEQMAELIGVMTSRMIMGRTAPVSLQIGYVDTDNIVRHDGIRITEASEAILTGLVEYVRNMRQMPGAAYVGISLHDGALHIR